MHSEPNPRGALLLHGLTSSSGEVGALKTFLESKGIICRAPLFPGHGTDIRDLASTSHLSWIETAKNEWRSLCETTSERFIIGESLGALIALILAENETPEEKPTGVVALSIPFRIARHEKLLQFFSWIPDSLLHLLWCKKKGTRSNEGRHQYQTYNAHHVGAAARLIKLRRILLEHIRLIDVPVLFLQDPGDDHIEPNSSELLSQLIPNSRVEQFPGGSHQLLCGKERENVFQRIETFMYEKR